jgi:phosphatidylglycerophosphate synthase
MNTTPDTAAANRRPLKTRGTQWAAACARALAHADIRPNQISIMSVAFAGFAAVDLALIPFETKPWRIVLLADAALCIQLRLLCNMLDGMVAIEGGFRTRSGEIYNELPDRIADALILIGAGYASHWLKLSPLLGFGAALCAVLVAYTRALGVVAGASQQFCGPMAKPHRMATLTVAALLSIIEILLDQPLRLLPLALILIVAGCLVTSVRRTVRILHELNSK